MTFQFQSAEPVETNDWQTREPYEIEEYEINRVLIAHEVWYKLVMSGLDMQGWRERRACCFGEKGGVSLMSSTNVMLKNLELMSKKRSSNVVEEGILPNLIYFDTRAQLVKWFHQPKYFAYTAVLHPTYW